MKKKNLKSLALNKKSISKLNTRKVLGGAAAAQNGAAADAAAGTNSWFKMCGQSWDIPCEWSVHICDLPTIDVPTWNDSCFSLCNDKCNDW
ncbi:MAG: hypothetical protein AAF611_17340 [Bacteroidota bacterium]